MGTSGSYGGSGNSAWRAACQSFEQLVEGGGGGAAGAPTPAAGGPVPVGADQPAGASGTANEAALGAAAAAIANALALGAAAAAIANALARDDPERHPRHPRIYPLAGLLPRLPGGGGGTGGRGIGGGGGSSRGAGRTGDGSRRGVSRGIQRGSSALAAGYALRGGDRAALATLHLDLDALQTLGPRQQCDRILAAVLGDGDHPDEYALKKAAAEQLKVILSAETPPSALETVQDFISGYIYQLGLLEIRAQMKAGLDATLVVGIEKDLKQWIKSRVRSVRAGLAAAAAIPVAQMQEVAARIGQEAIRIIRAAVPAR